MTFLDIDEFEYCSAALREGLLAEISDRLKHEDIRVRTAAEMMKHYHIDVRHAQRVEQSCLTIFNGVQDVWELNPDQGSILSTAALLHEAGLIVNTRSLQKHSSYIVQQADLPGFNMDQQYLLSIIVRFFRGKLKVEQFSELYNTDARQCLCMVAILRLAVILNHHRTDDSNGLIEVKAKAKDLTLVFNEKWLASHQLIQDALEQEAVDIAQFDLLVHIETA